MLGFTVIESERLNKNWDRASERAPLRPSTRIYKGSIVEGPSQFEEWFGIWYSRSRRELHRDTVSNYFVRRPYWRICVCLISGESPRFVGSLGFVGLIGFSRVAVLAGIGLNNYAAWDVGVLGWAWSDGALQSFSNCLGFRVRGLGSRVYLGFRVYSSSIQLLCVSVCVALAVCPCECW